MEDSSVVDGDFARLLPTMIAMTNDVARSVPNAATPIAAVEPLASALQRRSVVDVVRALKHLHDERLVAAGDTTVVWPSLSTRVLTNALASPVAADALLRSGLVALLCRGAEAALRADVQASATSICGKQYKSGMYCYHCRDCEADRTCALCVECFDESKHVGHDYRLTAAGGGVCDCGDETAWNPAGFCDKHGRKSSKSASSSSSSPSSSSSLVDDDASVLAPVDDNDNERRLQRNDLGTLPVVEASVLTRVIPLLIDKFLVGLTEANSTATSALLVANLTLLCEMHGDACVALVGNYLLTRLSSGGVRLKIDMIVELHDLLHVSIREQRESEFKFGSLAVQLLTVPRISASLVLHRGTLAALLELLGKCFSARRVDGLLDTSAARTNDGSFFRVAVELGYLNSPFVAQYWVYHQPMTLVESLLNVLRLLQRANPNYRHKTHPPYDEFRAESMFSIMLDLDQVISLFLRGIESGPKPQLSPFLSAASITYHPLALLAQQNNSTTTTTTTTSYTDLIELGASLQSGVGFLLNKLFDATIRNSSFLEQFNLSGNETIWKKSRLIYRDIDLLLIQKNEEHSQTSISFHLPLHRLFAEALHTVVATWWNADIDIEQIDINCDARARIASGAVARAVRLIARDGYKSILSILEEPLQLAALIAQTNAGQLWSRNGQVLQTQILVYNQRFCRSMRANDLFLIQWSMNELWRNEMNSPIFLASLLSRFGCENVLLRSQSAIVDNDDDSFVCNRSELGARKIRALLREATTFLVRLHHDRSSLPLPRTQTLSNEAFDARSSFVTLLRYHLLHWLSLTPPNSAASSSTSATVKQQHAPGLSFSEILTHLPPWLLRLSGSGVNGAKQNRSTASDDDIVQKTILQIAVKSRFSGRFVLKAECWIEFDCCFAWWSFEQREIALSHFETVMSNSSTSTSSSSLASSSATTMPEAPLFSTFCSVPASQWPLMRLQNQQFPLIDELATATMLADSAVRRVWCHGFSPLALPQHPFLSYLNNSIQASALTSLIFGIFFSLRVEKTALFDKQNDANSQILLDAIHLLAISADVARRRCRQINASVQSQLSSQSTKKVIRELPTISWIELFSTNNAEEEIINDGDKKKSILNEMSNRKNSPHQSLAVDAIVEFKLPASDATISLLSMVIDMHDELSRLFAQSLVSTTATSTTSTTLPPLTAMRALTTIIVALCDASVECANHVSGIRLRQRATANSSTATASASDTNDASFKSAQAKDKAKRRKEVLLAQFAQQQAKFAASAEDTMSTSDDKLFAGHATASSSLTSSTIAGNNDDDTRVEDVCVICRDDAGRADFITTLLRSPIHGCQCDVIIEQDATTSSSTTTSATTTTTALARHNFDVDTDFVDDDEVLLFAGEGENIVLGDDDDDEDDEDEDDEGEDEFEDDGFEDGEIIFDEDDEEDFLFGEEEEEEEEEEEDFIVVDDSNQVVVDEKDKTVDNSSSSSIVTSTSSEKKLMSAPVLASLLDGVSASSSTSTSSSTTTTTAMIVSDSSKHTTQLLPGLIDRRMNGGLHLSQCGHRLHAGCLKRFRNARADATGISLSAQEYRCPLCKRLANAVMPPPARLPLLIADTAAIGPIASSVGDATVRWLVDLALDVVAQLPPPTRVHVDFERDALEADTGADNLQSFADDDDSLAAQRQRLRSEFPSFVRRVCQLDDDSPTSRSLSMSHSLLLTIITSVRNVEKREQVTSTLASCNELLTTLSRRSRDLASLNRAVATFVQAQSRRTAGWSLCTLLRRFGLLQFSEIDVGSHARSAPLMASELRDLLPCKCAIDDSASMFMAFTLLAMGATLTPVTTRRVLELLQWTTEQLAFVVVDVHCGATKRDVANAVASDDDECSVFVDDVELIAIVAPHLLGFLRQAIVFCVSALNDSTIRNMLSRVENVAMSVDAQCDAITNALGISSLANIVCRARLLLSSTDSCSLRRPTSLCHALRVVPTSSSTSSSSSNATTSNKRKKTTTSSSLSSSSTTSRSLATVKTPSALSEKLVCRDLLKSTIALSHVSTFSFMSLRLVSSTSTTTTTYSSSLVLSPAFRCASQSYRLFVELPEVYQSRDFFLKHIAVTNCAVCSDKPRMPVLCLLCGDVVCYDGGEFTIHAERHDGSFLCVVLRDTRLFAWTRGFFHIVANCYVDAHGEADIGMRRGRQLLLDRAALRAALDQWLAFDFTSSNSVVAM